MTADNRGDRDATDYRNDASRSNSARRRLPAQRLVFGPDPVDVTVAEVSDPLAFEIGEGEDLAELLEAARPAIVENPDPRFRKVEPFVKSGRVLAVTDVQGKPVYPDRDMAALAAGALPDQSAAGDEEEPAQTHWRTLRQELGQEEFDREIERELAG